MSANASRLKAEEGVRVSAEESRQERCTTRLYRATRRLFAGSTVDVAGSPAAHRQQRAKRRRRAFLRLLTTCSVIHVLGSVLNAALALLITSMSSPSSPKSNTPPRHVVSFTTAMRDVFLAVSVYMLCIGCGNLIFLRAYGQRYTRARVTVLCAFQATYVLVVSFYLVLLLFGLCLVNSSCACRNTERVIGSSSVTNPMPALVCGGSGCTVTAAPWVVVFGFTEVQAARFAGHYPLVQFWSCGTVSAATCRLGAATSIRRWEHLLLLGFALAFAELMALCAIQTRQLNEFFRNDKAEELKTENDAVSLYGSVTIVNT